jgi:hypothetical protein
VVSATESCRVDDSSLHSLPGIVTMVVGFVSVPGELLIHIFFCSCLGDVVGEGTCLPSTARL